MAAPFLCSLQLCPLLLSVHDKPNCILPIRRGPHAFTNVLMWDFFVVVTVTFVDVAQFNALTTLSLVFSYKSWMLLTVSKCLPFLIFASNYPDIIFIWFSGTLQNTCSFLTETVLCVITFILSIVIHIQNNNITSSTLLSQPLVLLVYVQKFCFYLIIHILFSIEE